MEGFKNVLYGPLKVNNGIIESRNKIIKCIKHNANGYSNQKRFRDRPMYVSDKDITYRLNLTKDGTSWYTVI